MCSVTCSPIDTLPVPASTDAPTAIEVAPNSLGAARRSSSPAAAGDSGDGYETVRCSGPALREGHDPSRRDLWSSSWRHSLLRSAWILEAVMDFERRR